MPFFASLQVKYALSYLVVITLVLALLNTYPVLASQDLLFTSKRDSLKSQSAVIASALMELLMRNPGRVYSRENLLNVVWGYEYVGDYRTVDVHIRRLREKLELDPANPEYIRTKWGVGYYLSSQKNSG